MSLTARLVAVFMGAALFFPVGARAMTLEAFERMNNDDESTYVAILIEAAAQKYKSEGQPEQAAQLMAYFKTPGRDGGVQQFAAHLVSINATNNRNATNPNNRVAVLQVEDAMELTLKDHGYTNVPAKYLLASAKDFRPVGPPRGMHPMTP